MSQGQAEVDYSVWITQDKRVFKIVEMADSHLVNTVRFLMGQLSISALTNAPKESWKRKIVKERELRTTRHLDALRAEALRRGLEIS